MARGQESSLKNAGANVAPEALDVSITFDPGALAGNFGLLRTTNTTHCVLFGF